MFTKRAVTITTRLIGAPPTSLARANALGYRHTMTGHGFRSIASTWGNEHGYNRDHIEMQLAHSDDDDIRGAYNNALYLEPRRKMLQEFADWIMPGLPLSLT